METTLTETSQPVTLNDLKSVLEKMNRYKRKAGYMVFDLAGKLEFFDSEPSFGGAYVTKSDVLSYIASY